jgi:predicted RNA-binding Zn ribbon-like protein
MEQPYGFEFIAGSLALAFVDTLGGRATLRTVERIATPARFADWLAAAGLALPGAVPGAADHADALRLRSAIAAAAGALVRSEAPDAADIACINRFAAAPPLRPQFGPGAPPWTADRPIAAALSTIAADAIDTLRQPDRLRECGECRMLFLDATRGGRRRWCSSSSGCGNRAKVQRHRARRAGQST